MRVLNLVSNGESRFFAQQVDVLESRGVAQTTIAVPTPFVPGEARRSIVDYLRILPPTIRRSFGDYDLLHANSGLTAPAAVVQPNLPTVVSLWGTDLMGPYGSITRRFTRLCDDVIVMSDEMAAQYGGSCRVIPHGVDLGRFEPAPQEEAQEAVGWSTDAKHVLFPYPRERQVKDYPRAKRIVSRADERVEIEVVHQIVSGVPNEDMSTYMNAADVLLLTSEREGSPNSVKEALACNLPVVSTRVGDVVERLEGVTLSVASDDNAELVEGVVAALESDARSNGRENAQKVSIDHMADRILEVYRDVSDAR